MWLGSISAAVRSSPIASSDPAPPAASNSASARSVSNCAVGGAGSDEAMGLLRTAAEMDPSHIQSRLYLGAELTRTGQYDDAARFWRAAIDLAQGDEPWLPAARQGLAVAENDGVDTTAADQAEMIRGMVGSLSTRLYAEGGTVEEWSQLVRSYIVLGLSLIHI